MLVERKKIEKCVVLFVTFFILSGLTGTAFALQSEPKGTVESMERNAWIIREGKRFDLKPGSKIHEFDIVRTDKMGTVTVRFIDDTLMTLMKDSEALIVDINWTPKSSRFNVGVNRGFVRFKTGSIVLNNHHGYNLSTPKSIINMQDSTVLIGVTPKEETVKVEAISDSRTVSVVNKKTLEAIDIGVPQHELMTDSANMMSFTHYRNIEPLSEDKQ